MTKQPKSGFLVLVLLLLSLFSFSDYHSTEAQSPRKTTTELPVERVYKRNQNNTVYYFSKNCNKRPIINDKLFYSKIAATQNIIFQVELAVNARKILNVKPIGLARLTSSNIYFSEKSSSPDHS